MIPVSTLKCIRMATKKLQIKIEASKRFFCFYALLNVLGYNPETLPAHPIRRKTRIFLKRALAGSENDLSDIKKMIERPDIGKEFWFPLRNWVLCHGEPPLFRESSPYWNNFLDAPTGEKFGRELKYLWKAGRLASLWATVKIAYSKAGGKCLRNTRTAVKTSLEYLHFENKKLDFEKFVVIPNFLDEYNRGIGPKIGGTAYAILGPSKGADAFPLQRIQHEFLHSLVNPITLEILGSRISKPELSSVRELLIQAMVLRLNSSDAEYYRKKMERLKNSGFKDIDKAIDFLKNYERQKDNFEAFLSRNKIWSQ